MLGFECVLGGGDVGGEGRGGERRGGRGRKRAHPTHLRAKPGVVPPPHLSQRDNTPYNATSAAYPTRRNNQHVLFTFSSCPIPDPVNAKTMTKESRRTHAPHNATRETRPTTPDTPLLPLLSTQQTPGYRASARLPRRGYALVRAGPSMLRREMGKGARRRGCWIGCGRLCVCRRNRGG